jgi:hypothetical protein
MYRSKFDGYGEYKFKSGGAYKGEFKDGQFHGCGRFVLCGCSIQSSPAAG